MMKNKISLDKITTRKISRMIYLLIICIIIIIIVFASTFLYTNFYQTITQSKEVLILQQKVVVETVDINKFNQIIEKLTIKLPRKIGNIRNPF